MQKDVKVTDSNMPTNMQFNVLNIISELLEKHSKEKNVLVDVLNILNRKYTEFNWAMSHDIEKYRGATNYLVVNVKDKPVILLAGVRTF